MKLQIALDVDAMEKCRKVSDADRNYVHLSDMEWKRSKH